MGGSSSSPLDIVAGVATGGIYTAYKANEERVAAKRAARTAADQQKDAMIAQQQDLKNKGKEAKQTAGNIALRNRLAAQRGYARAASRGGTILTSPTGLPPDNGGGGKMLLGT